MPPTLPPARIASRRAETLDQLRTLAYREGNFTLASGRKSSYYLNSRAVTLHPIGARLVGDLFAEAIRDIGPLDVCAIGGMATGAIPIATATSLALLEQGIAIPSVFVRDAAKTHGTGSRVEGLENVSRSHGRVVVLEDVTTTGGSALKAVAALRDEGLGVAAIVTLVDREEGGAQAIAEALGPHFRFHPIFTRSEITSHRVRPA